MKCQHCGTAVFWAFSADRYLHTGSRLQRCQYGRGEVATPSRRAA